jgi:hypothetical protein
MLSGNHPSSLEVCSAERLPGAPGSILSQSNRGSGVGYLKGLPTKEIRGDFRGRYGIGRPAHGSDPNASYQFGEESTRTPLASIPLEAPTTSTTVTVTDLHYELQRNDKHRACLKVFIASMDRQFEFDITFPLDHQEGRVDATLEHAQACLITFLHAVLNDLQSRPLHLS